MQVGRDDIAWLAHELALSTDLALEPPDVDRVVRDVPAETDQWTQAVELIAAGLGLRVRWRLATPEELLHLARVDLPLVSWANGWWMATDRRLGRAHLRRPDRHHQQAWMPPSKLEAALGPQPRSWAQLEPMLPASSLSGGPRASRPVDRLRSLLRAERRDVLAVFVFAIATGVLTLATPLAIQVLINWLAFGSLLQPVVALAIALLACLLLAAGLRSTQRHAIEVIQRRLFVRAVTDLATRLRRVEVGRLDKAYGPELVNRFFDVLTLQKATSALLLDGLSATLQAVVGLLLLAFYHPILLAFDVAVVIVVVAVLLPLGRGAERTAIAESKAKYDVAGWIEEIARHPLAFRLGGARLGEERAEALTRSYLMARAAHFRVFFRQYVGVQGIQAAVPVVLLVTCGWLVLQGQLTLGQLVAAEFIIASALAGITKFSDKLETLYDLLAGVDKLGSLVDLPVERTLGLVRREVGSPARVGMRDVHYAHERSAQIVRFPHLEVPPGERVAIYGPTGQQSNLLADLLIGARSPDRGVVLRDDLPLSTLRPDDSYLDASLVRDGGLLHSTVRANIDLARDDVDERAIWKALQELGMHEAVRRLPAGLDTLLSPSGRPLSDAQTRVLLIARAIAGRPRLVIIDGVLDRLPRRWQRRALDVLIDGEQPWTLVVFTDDPFVRDRCQRCVPRDTGEATPRSDDPAHSGELPA